MLIAIVAAVALARTLSAGGSLAAQAPAGATDTFSDSHFHLTNYIQQGIDVRQYMEIMGARVRRSTLFSIPLQQQWSYANSGNFAHLVPAQRCPAVLLLVHGRLSRDGVPLAVERRVGALRPDDPRLGEGQCEEKAVMREERG